MKSMIALFACVAFASAQILLNDDGQWHPELDGSILGQYNPILDGSLPPLVAARTIIGSPLIHALKKRSVLATPWAAHGLVAAHAGLINPNALNVPLDTVHVAAAKNAQLISQATEGARNILGGGIPAALPADTPEVAAGKVAHAIAHENQKVATAGIWAPGLVAAPGVVASRSLLSGLVAPHGIVGARSLLW